MSINRNLNRLLQEKLNKLASEVDALVEGNKQGAHHSDSSEAEGQAQMNVDDEEDHGSLSGALGAPLSETLIPEKDTTGPTSIVNGLKEAVQKKLETN